MSPHDVRNARRRDEASVWLAQLERGLRAQEGAVLREWLKDAANRSVILEMAALHHGPDVLSVLKVLFPASPEFEKRKPVRGRPLLSGFIPATAAACIVGVLAILLMGSSPWAYFTNTAHAALPSRDAGVFSTAIGERREVTLEDGTAVTMNTSTQMKVFCSQNSREVTLATGEASFHVARDAARPFIVHAGARDFQAVGTRFNVRVISPEYVELTVTEGEVKLLYGPPRLPETPAKRRENLTWGEATLGATDIAFVEPGYQTVRRLEPGELAARMAWQRGRMVFDGVALEDAIAELDRYTTTRFVLADDRLRGMRIGGDFRTGDVEGLLLTLRQEFLVNARRDAQGRIVLSSRASL